MTENHPITPPPELIGQWLEEFFGPETMPGMAPGEVSLHIATQAARWGADQELEACCEWLDSQSLRYLDGSYLRAALARWGTPNFAETRSSLGDAPHPVPVSERLPVPKDCDVEQQCWWWSPPTFERVGCWMLSRGTGAETHWLSFHVLPIPTAND